jgi:hypothetical protein
MQIPDSQYIAWNEETPTYLVPGDTFEEWRLKTNGLKVLIDDTKVDRNGDTMDGPLIITNNESENNFIQFPDGSTQYTAAQRQLLPRAWVNFNGNQNTVGTASSASNENKLIRSSYNVSSVTKLNDGAYQINFITPLANTKYCAMGTGVGTFDNSNPNINSQAFITPYNLTKDYVKVSSGDPTGNNANDPALASVIVYATDEPDATYTGSTTFEFTLQQDSNRDTYQSSLYVNPWAGSVNKYSVDSYWTLFGKITSSTVNPLGNYIFKIKDGKGWQNTPMNTTGTSVTLMIGQRYRLAQSNVFTTSMDLLVLEVYSATTGDLLKTWDVQKRITVATTNGNTVSTISNPSFSDINTTSSYPDITGFTISQSTTFDADPSANTNLLSQAIFSFTVTA